MDEILTLLEPLFCFEVGHPGVVCQVASVRGGDDGGRSQRETSRWNLILCL